MQIWMISDFHFSHENIVAYGKRPYNDLYEMETKMVENWNIVVDKEDIVYFLGDFNIGPHTERNDKNLVGNLAGHKKMILGNHDKHFNVYLPEGQKKYSINTDNEAIAYWKEAGFEEVFSHPIVLNNYFILSHEPINGINKTQIFANIHGHTHDVVLTNGNYFNVSVENISYTPINFEDIKEIFAL